jgi:hypothetical protein
MDNKCAVEKISTESHAATVGALGLAKNSISANSIAEI